MRKDRSMVEDIAPWVLTALFLGFALGQIATSVRHHAAFEAFVSDKVFFVEQECSGDG